MIMNIFLNRCVWFLIAKLSICIFCVFPVTKSILFLYDMKIVYRNILSYFPSPSLTIDVAEYKDNLFYSVSSSIHHHWYNLLKDNSKRIKTSITIGFHFKTNNPIRLHFTWCLECVQNNICYKRWFLWNPYAP